MAVRRVARDAEGSPEAMRLRDFLTFSRESRNSGDPLLKRKVKIDRQLRKLRIAAEDGPVQVVE
jgi:hypothetical protein